MKRLLLIFFLFTVLGSVTAQDSTLRGKVIDNTNTPLSGVSIVVKGTAISAVTDDDGQFNLKVPSNKSSTLLVSYVGFQSKEIAINGNQRQVSISLAPDSKDMNEVVVIGYGTMKKSDVTGAVASVNSKSLNTLPTGNPIEALQGKISGVNIGAVTSPGETPQIRIRGNRSLNASNEPLYVVDGIPRNTIEDIPVSDIESIEVLKDAASAAVYGSRGANGVILITTKRAKTNSKTQISYNSYFGVNQAKFPKLMNGEEYVKFRQDVFRANQNTGWASGVPANERVFGPKELAIVNSGQFVDWQDMMYNKNSLTQEHNLSISHGSDKTQMVLSLGYRNEEGYYKTNDIQRINMGINLDHKISKAIKIGLSSRLTNTSRNLFTTPDVNMLYMNPTSKPYDEDGNMIWNPSTQQTAAWNILANYQEPYINKTDYLRSFNVLYGEVTIADGLKLRTNLGIDLDQGKIRQYYGSNTTLRYGRPDYARKEDVNKTGILWDNILSYNKTFNEKHTLNGTLVTSFQRQNTNRFSASGEGMPGEDLEDWNLGSAVQNIIIGSSREEWTLGSFLGRFQYGYDDRFIINFSVRADGSSVLAEDKKWGYFPAVSAAWTISNEKFFNVAAINTLKLRGSYGVVGNSAISPYETIAGTTQTTYNFGEATYFGYRLAGLVNKNLGWEYSRTLNFGLDFGLMGNRISGTIEAYNTVTSDLLMQRSIPDFTGSSTVFQNIGSTSNSGFELMLNSTNVKGKNFSWTTDFNFYTNKEKIVSLLTDDDMVGDKWFIGKPVGVFYDYEKLGIWQTDKAADALKYNQKPGDVRLMDQNGDGRIDADNDRIVLGQTSPKFGVFLRNSFMYSGFTFSIALEGKVGHLVNSPTLGGDLFFDGTRWGPAALAGNYWTPDNPGGEYPYVNRAVEARVNLYGIRDASYLNVQELSLGYNFSKIKNIKGLNVYARIKNPFYIYRADTDLDPQAPNFNYAAFRTNVIGLSVNL
ncbi:SusC/RagA family TonB-linked outer membrane protein [Flavitalea sp.]|nr:TonB-dependent receptor [Flavitalea sp.]